MGAWHQLPVFTRKILICAHSALTLCQVNVRMKGPLSNTILLNLKLLKDSSSERIIQSLAQMILFKYMYQKSNHKSLSSQYNWLLAILDISTSSGAKLSSLYILSYSWDSQLYSIFNILIVHLLRAGTIGFQLTAWQVACSWCWSSLFLLFNFLLFK